MATLQFEEVLSLTSDEAWAFTDSEDEMSVVCSDGVLKTSPEDFFINYYCWKMFNELDPEFPSSTRYTISVFEHTTPSTHLDVCSGILKDYVLWEESRGNIPNLEPIMRIVYEITNNLDNEIDNRMECETVDLCFDHLLEIYEDPDVVKANNHLATVDHVEHEDIATSHKAVNFALMHKVEYLDNPLAQSSKCMIIKLTQASMVLGSIGYCTDINSKIIPSAIRPGFFRGMRKFDDLLYESRNASIAALFNLIIMAISEYANRRYLLPAESIKNKVHGDCGADAIEIIVTNKAKLESLAGFVQLDGRRGKRLGYLTKDQTDLIGKKVWLRGLNKCLQQPRDSICTTCLGLMHYSFPEGSVIGHSSGVQLGSTASTQVLQRKHQNLTSQVSDIEMGESFQQYFRTDNMHYGYRFAKDFNYKDWYLTLTPAEALYLKELESDYGDKLVASNTTKVEIIKLVAKEGFESIEMAIGFGQRAGFLSKPFLEYVRHQGWTLTDGNMYRIDMSGWNDVRPFIQLPKIEFTPPDLIDAMTNFIFSGSRDKNKTFKTPMLIDFHTAEDAFEAFYDLISQHLKGIHSVHLQMLILAMSAQDPKTYDYRLPYPREFGKVAKLDNIMRYRSVAGAMAYEEQNRMFLDPLTYLVDKRPGHIYDSILMG